MTTLHDEIRGMINDAGHDDGYTLRLTIPDRNNLASRLELLLSQPPPCKSEISMLSFEQPMRPYDSPLVETPCQLLTVTLMVPAGWTISQAMDELSRGVA